MSELGHLLKQDLSEEDYGSVPSGKEQNGLRMTCLGEILEP